MESKKNDNDASQSNQTTTWVKEKKGHGVMITYRTTFSETNKRQTCFVSRVSKPQTVYQGMSATLPQPLVDDFAVPVPQLVVDDVPRLERRLDPPSPAASSAST